MLKSLNNNKHFSTPRLLRGLWYLQIPLIGQIRAEKKVDPRPQSHSGYAPNKRKGSCKIFLQEAITGLECQDAHLITVLL